MSPEQVVLVVGIGLGAGVMAGLFGVGGGVLMVPAMVLLLGYPQHLAQGTSLLVIIPTAIVGTYTHWRNGYVRFERSAMLALGGILGAVVGSGIALSVDGTTLRRVFVVYLFLTGVRMLLPRSLGIRRLLGREPAGTAAAPEPPTENES